MRRGIGPAAAIGMAAAAAAAACMALLAPMRACLAWGPQAHRTIALIAELQLRRSDPGALATVRALLATDKSGRLARTDIADEAIWADVLLEHSPEARTATTAWHWARLTPDNPDFAAACFGHKPLPAGYPASHGPQDNCSLDKVVQFAAELKDPATSPHERLAALQFVLNLVGDLNDPLHAIDRGDRGGICVAVQIGDHAPVRLATLWEDTLVGEIVGSDAARGAARILASVPAAEAQQWAAGNPEAWAREAYDVAKTVAYSFAGEKPAETVIFRERKGGQPAAACPAAGPVYKVGLEYETKALAAVKTQLAKAGLRLARLLADSFK